MTERFKMPPEITDEMKTAAYRCYVERAKKGYIAFEDICACFTAAFEARGDMGP
jgi:hypothetical protein